MVPPRKQRKSQTLTTEVVDEDANSDTAKGSLSPQIITVKEREVWDAFREEHFEAIEQLPLSLHRQYALIHELEQQSITYMANLSRTLKQYIEKRRNIMHKFRPVIGGNDFVAQFDISGPRVPTREDSMTTTPRLVNGIGPNPDNSPNVSPPAGLPKPTLLDTPPEHISIPQTTRQMLSYVGYLTEELLRASDEKVNLARAAYESVNRHACILEQAIKEQEASISSGARPRHLEALTLPELVPPRWAQMAPATPTADDEIEILLGNHNPEHPAANYSSQLPYEVKGRRRRFRGKRGKTAILGGNSDVQGTSLTITLPGQTMGGDPEETFCHCGRVSFGAMVGCDNNSCEGQWFHLGCVGLTELPTAGTWYCSPECQAIAELKSLATRKRKRK